KSNGEIILQTAIGERPNNVGIGHGFGGTSKRADGARIALEAALAVTLLQKVLVRAAQHLFIHGKDLGHVAKLQETVGGEGLMRRRGLAEPLVALTLAR